MSERAQALSVWDREKAKREAWNDYHGTASDCEVLWSLVVLADEHGDFSRGYRTLAKDAKRSKTTAYRCVEKLIEQRVVTPWPPEPGSCCSVLSLNIGRPTVGGPA
jgi:hypothetical protein